MAKADQTKAAETNPETDPQDGVALGEPEQGQPPDDAARNAAESADGKQPDPQADEQTSEPTDSTDPQAPSTLSPQELLERFNEINAENAQMKDGLLRARAEIENIRRRSQNEIVAARKYAIEGFAQELLGVRDSLDQASSVELDESAGEAMHKMKEGLGLTLKQLDIAMARFAVVEVEAGPGVRFDPERHQAISMTPSEEIEADHIVSVVQKGFLLKERLLRPAMVVVAEDQNRGGEGG